MSTQATVDTGELSKIVRFLQSKEFYRVSTLEVVPEHL
jgi:hypothetical protein